MYHPTGRVLTVLELLQSRPGITGPELAMRLETDVRTVRRYIAKLQDVGIPVEANSGRYGGYHLRPGYKLPPLIFSEEEASAVVLGLLGSSWLEIEQSQAAISGAISKITRVLPKEARERLDALSSVLILNPRRDHSHPGAALLIDLSESIQARKAVELVYTTGGQTTQRVVEPYGLVGRSGNWYLVGYCRLREAYRTFRLDRIESLRVLAESFVRDEEFNFRSYAEEHLATYPGRRRFRVLFKTDAATVRRKIPPIDGPLTESAEGVIFEGRTDDFDYQARHLVSLEIPFLVKDPPELREALVSLSREIAASAGDERAAASGEAAG